jgi:hypothetical protein
VPRTGGAVIPEDEVRAELGRILASHEFRSSKRSEEFLRYVVENTLNGRTETLRERIIGIEVFGRPPSYDPSEDATVRVKAGEVRKRLGIYYSGEGHHNPMRIELPAGTYIPEFRPIEKPPAKVESPVAKVAAPVAPTPIPGSAPLRWKIWVAVLAGVTAGILGAAGVSAFWMRTPAMSPILEQFWGPVLQGMAPVSLCAAFVPDVYGLNRQANGVRPTGAEDFLLLPDQFVGGGDLIAVSRLSAMLTRKRRAYQVRIGGEVSFRDLETAPAVLVGYSYTHWKDISSALRYFIDAGRRPVVITDNGSPTKWSLPNLPADRHTTEDYAIVTRVFHPDTHSMLVELAGITQYGTDAAADLVTNPDLLAEALRDAASGWEKKNLQLVLHVKVVSGSPSSPRLVASYFW